MKKLSLSSTNKKFIKNSVNSMDYDDMLNKLVGFINYDLDTNFQASDIKDLVDDYIYILDQQDAD